MRAVAAPRADSTKRYDGVFWSRKDTLRRVLHTQVLEVIECAVSRDGLRIRKSRIRITLGALRHQRLSPKPTPRDW